jgi:predicted permease
MIGVARDLRYGARTLRRDRAFSLVAIAVLTLGIGGIAAIFTLVNALALKPRVLEAPERLVGLYSRDTTRPDAYRAFSYATFVDLAAQARPELRALMAHSIAMVGIQEGDEVRRTLADIVSASYFETLGVPLARGRAFTAEEERPGADVRVAIVGHALWQRRGSDPGILGSTIRVNGRPFTVVGVAPPRFHGRAALIGPEVWLPLGVYERAINDFDGERRPLADPRHAALMLVGRLADGATTEAAESKLARVGAELARADPAGMANHELTIAPISRISISTSPSRDDELATVSVLLLAMAGVVLAISCLNLANMLLARGTARRREFAVRLAIGGGRWQIVRQLLIEGLLLSLVGGAAGAVLAYWGDRLLIASLTAVLPVPISFPVGPDARTLGALFAFCLISSLLFGLGPALQLARSGIVPGLKSGAGSASAPVGRRRGAFAPRNLLVIGQLSLSMVLLAAAGLFVRGAHEASHPDLGFPIEGAVLAEVDASLAGLDAESARPVYARALERLRSLPGVAAASYSATVPFGMVSLGDRVAPAGSGAGRGDGGPEARSASTHLVGADYFEALGIELVAGRPFSRAEEESPEAPPVVIVDRTLAEALWPGESALGRRLEVVDEPRREYEVVGVAPATRHGLFGRDPSRIFLPFGRHFQSDVHFLVRAREPGLEAGLLASIRGELRAVDDRLPLLGLVSLEQQMEGSIELWTLRIAARLFTLFGVLALFIAAVGAYGLRAYAVGQRTKEIGLRMALGATPAGTLRMVLGEGLALTLVGLGLGLALALGAGRLLANLLYEVSAADPLVFAVTPLFLLAAIALACWLPARRASRLQPMAALRDE